MLRQMPERISDDLAVVAKQARTFLQRQWQAHGHRLKTPTGTRVVRAFAASVLVCVLIFGCQWTVHRPERLRIEAARQAEQARQDAALARVRREEAQRRKAAWQQFSREHSNHPVTYEVVYTSWLWLPILGLVALVYALASRAYLFMAIGKTLLLLIFLTSVALVIGDMAPFVAEWEFFKDFKETATMLAAHLGVPVIPPLWLGGSLVGGILVEGLSRLGSRSKIIVNTPRVVVSPPHVVVNLPPNVPPPIPLPPLPPKL